ncbi:MAG: hypothetical protein HGA85_05920 [Nanoarchaeota archaeon]|nr:hypothetical protein [Nanoarchaeota archaeon]
MDKKLLAMAFVGILGLGLSVFLAVKYWPTKDCYMESPLSCFEPKAGVNGFAITFGNNVDETLFIQDITISKKGGKKCIFIKPEINGELDYYEQIEGQSAISFIISPEHPDGECLMTGLAVGEELVFDVEITYIFDGKRLVSKGGGKAVMTDRII